MKMARYVLGTAMVLGGSTLTLSTLIRSQRENWPPGRAAPGMVIGLLVSLAGRGLYPEGS